MRAKTREAVFDSTTEDINFGTKDATRTAAYDETILETDDETFDSTDDTAYISINIAASAATCDAITTELKDLWKKKNNHNVTAQKRKGR